MSNNLLPVFTSILILGVSSTIGQKSYISERSPIVSMMQQTSGYNLRSGDARDPFNALRNQQQPGSTKTLNEYDFIVVGSGASGSVIANRLSEDGRWSVLLLEAGGPASFFSDIPLLANYFKLTDLNWGYQMEKQDGICMAMEDQRCGVPRGKALGGSTVINYMMHTRGFRSDWDRVAAAGNPGWSFNEVLPYFLKSERANLKGLENSPYHNRHGLLSVEDIPFRTPLARAFLKAGEELGEKIVDYNEGDKMGFSYLQATTSRGRRHSAARAFLDPFRGRSNLKILPNSRVVKINIKKKTREAKSVDYVRNRKIYTAKAKKEIILSAGTFGSAQLLMLSGIGPINHLQQLGIKVIQNSPVGQNMHDRTIYPGLIFTMNRTDIAFKESNLNPRDMNTWLNGNGPLTIPAGFESIAYLKTKYAQEPDNYPDLELLVSPASLSSEASGITWKGLPVSKEFYEKVYKEIEEKDAFTIFIILTRPTARGYLLLKDKNPFHWPKIHHNFYANKKDLDTMVEGIKYGIKISKTKAFQRFGVKLYKKHFPMCADFKFGSDDYWACAARSLSVPFQHHVGTCKMGPPNDPEAIVDNELRVYGIKGLRVGDSSIIPMSLNAHTGAPAYMIGEKLSDMIKYTWFNGGPNANIRSY